MNGQNESSTQKENIGQAVQKPTPEQERARKRKRRRKALVGLLLRILALAIVVYVLFFVIIGVTVAPNGDMYPRVDAGDLVAYYRLDKDVSAQDIIAFEKPRSSVTSASRNAAVRAANQTDADTAGQSADAKEEKALFIGRVVAVAGDTVEITESGNLVVNGSTMIESNIFYRTYPYAGYTEYPLTLGEGECFVLGDRREQGAADSRFFGPVHKEEILGTVITIIRRNNL